MNSIEEIAKILYDALQSGDQEEFSKSFPTLRSILKKEENLEDIPCSIILNRTLTLFILKRSFKDIDVQRDWVARILYLIIKQYKTTESIDVKNESLLQLGIVLRYCVKYVGPLLISTFSSEDRFNIMKDGRIPEEYNKPLFYHMRSIQSFVKETTELWLESHELPDWMNTNVSKLFESLRNDDQSVKDNYVGLDATKFISMMYYWMQIRYNRRHENELRDYLLNCRFMAKKAKYNSGFNYGDSETSAVIDFSVINDKVHTVILGLNESLIAPEFDLYLNDFNIFPDSGYIVFKQFTFFGQKRTQIPLAPYECSIIVDEGHMSVIYFYGFNLDTRPYEFLLQGFSI